jgi:hypothetical protein
MNATTKLDIQLTEVDSAMPFARAEGEDLGAEKPRDGTPSEIEWRLVGYLRAGRNEGRDICGTENKQVNTDPYGGITVRSR